MRRKAPPTHCPRGRKNLAASVLGPQSAISQRITGVSFDASPSMMSKWCRRLSTPGPKPPPTSGFGPETRAALASPPRSASQSRRVWLPRPDSPLRPLLRQAAARRSSTDQAAGAGQRQARSAFIDNSKKGRRSDRGEIGMIRSTRPATASGSTPGIAMRATKCPPAATAAMPALTLAVI